MPAHPVRCRRVKAVARKELIRRIRRDDAAVKEHAHQIRILRAELHIVRDHDDCHTALLQFL